MIALRLFGRLLDAITRWAFRPESILIDRLTTDAPLPVALLLPRRRDVLGQWWDDPRIGACTVDGVQLADGRTIARLSEHRAFRLIGDDDPTRYWYRLWSALLDVLGDPVSIDYDRTIDAALALLRPDDSSLPVEA